MLSNSLNSRKSCLKTYIIKQIKCPAQLHTISTYSNSSICYKLLTPKYTTQQLNRKIEAITQELRSQRALNRRSAEDLVSTKHLLLKICDDKAVFESRYKDKLEYIGKIESALSKGSNDKALISVNDNLNSQLHELKLQIKSMESEISNIRESERQIQLRNAALEEALVFE